ncbi:MAG: M20 family metallo-hydrolase, partial [Candidatus Kapaibacterium sp.]
MTHRTHKSIELLKRLIATPSLSREESAAAEIMQEFLTRPGVQVFRQGNNVWATAEHFDERKPTILVNSHLDTVKPNADWTRDPFTPVVEGDMVYGLGSNDAGGPLVCYAATFLQFAEEEPGDCNVVFAATAEEEISGSGGIMSVLDAMPRVDLACVGEPTEMQMAIAEKGLMVVQCRANGRSGHAARNEGVNAIDIALRDIAWIHGYGFERVSDLLGPVKMTTTIIHAGTQHNVVPAECTFTVDIRSTEAYTHEEILETIRGHLESEIISVSKRLHPSSIDPAHPVVQAAVRCGMSLYGSPTLSDQALLTMPRVKIGPGSSSRSHTADEYILLSEIVDGIEGMIRLLEETMPHMH